jgi:hypothetical protein
MVELVEEMSILFKYPSEYLVYNAIQTPDGTILESTHRHDYKEHVDEKGGLTFVIDGGLLYRRVVGGGYKDLSITTNDHVIAREYLKWGTYGKNGDQPLTRVPICDLSTSHIYNILTTQSNILEQVHLCLTYELLLRAFTDSEWESDLYDEEVEHDE